METAILLAIALAAFVTGVVFAVTFMRNTDVMQTRHDVKVIMNLHAELERMAWHLHDAKQRYAKLLGTFRKHRRITRYMAEVRSSLDNFKDEMNKHSNFSPGATRPPSEDFSGKPCVKCAAPIDDKWIHLFDVGVFHPACSPQTEAHQ